MQDIADILPFVIGWYDDKFFHWNVDRQETNLQQIVRVALLKFCTAHAHSAYAFLSMVRV
jgi:hypothetical protein